MLLTIFVSARDNVKDLRKSNVNHNIYVKRKETVMSRPASALTVIPRLVHPAPEPLGLYFRVGRNDHRELLQLLSSGETRFFGLVCDPTYTKFQRELVDRAIERRLDVILDPRTQPSSTVGGFSSTLDRAGCSRVSLLYSLGISYSMLRDPAERRALIRGLRELPVEGVWLGVDGVGSGSTPTAVRTYLEALTEFHTLRLPVVADHIGGLVGLAFVAFGGVGALAHGVTTGERFDTAHWRRPRPEDSFGLARRVYVPTLDLLLKPAEARALFGFGRRATGLFGCGDSRCCPRGVTDMLENPAQHFLRRRIDEISKLSAIPTSLRPSRFVEQRLRSTTDAVLAAANLPWLDEDLGKRMREQRKRLDRLRIALGDLAESVEKRSIAVVPRRRIARTAVERPSVSP
jgi:hypothetical protein